MKFLARFERFCFLLLGPAETGPYGPPVAPPAPRPRDSHGRLLTGRQLARLAAAS